MKKVLIALCLLCLSAVTYAQSGVTEGKRYGLLDRNKSKGPVAEKYLAGACPEVNGKVQWDKSIEAPDMTAQQIYEKLQKFLNAFIKEDKKTDQCKITLADAENRQFAVRVQEWLVFENKPLSLDQTKFNYQLIISCKEGRCDITMRNMSYIYEEDRGGGQMPAEDMIADSEALNKTKDGFHKGGYKKFRVKTIDRKDEIFARFEALLAEK